MIKLRTSEKQNHVAMLPNSMEILTATLKDETMTKGIPCVQHVIKEETNECNKFIIDSEKKDKEFEKYDEKTWNEFWKYFAKFWLSSDDFVSKWNTCDENNKCKISQNRTNNALERYNRVLNETFGDSHPSLIKFVTTLEKEELYKVQEVEEIKCGKSKPTNHDNVRTNGAPDECVRFE